MKLPNFEKAIVPREKITDYLLSFSHRDGRGKAAFFALFGFTTQSWQTLAGALLQHAAEHEVAKIEETHFGTRYVIEGELKTPVGRAPTIRVVWFIDLSEEIPRQATAYPQRKE
ncbi:MAG TPA: hypothetical protein VGC66_21750 [Pyrinomonadaceae bacterium]|jgi:hypothetical protein